MLYTPPAFKVEDVRRLWALMEAEPFATLVTVAEGRPIISHVPLLLDRLAGKFGRLVGHLAKANPQIVQTRTDCLAVAVFQGPEAYVSPGWYASKKEHGKVVPTWNYATVHARGPIRFIEDAVRLRSIVNTLTDRHETGREKPWSTADAPSDYLAAQLKGIVGFEIEITELDGKFKMSQNRPEADRKGVIAGLLDGEDESDRDVAELMQKL